jgi:hypothetical protein
MWTLQEALAILAKLEPELKKMNAHCGLTGSVMYRGDSKKDLDIIIYPRHKNSEDHWKVEDIKKFLAAYFGASEFKDCSSASQERDDKAVSWIITEDGKRIDFFFLS